MEDIYMQEDKLILKSFQLLSNMYDHKTGLFSFSTKIQNAHYINDYSDKGKYRYTINSLLGLHKIEMKKFNTFDINASIDTYLRKHYKQDLNFGNKGLLLHLLSVRNNDFATVIFKELVEMINQGTILRKISLQEVSWISLGLSSYSYYFSSNSSGLIAKKIIRFLIDNRLNERTLIPKYDQSYRGSFISFGGIAYFLYALHYYSSLFSDNYVQSVFIESVQQVLKLQGKYGEWPWFVNSNNANVIDWYQIYSVHQDSMAHLFLLPAFDLGVDNTKKSITSSYKWLFGRNHSKYSMITDEPFFIYRSFIKNRKNEKLIRFINGGRNLITGRKGELSNFNSINKECRSYHIGWILYVWANRTDFKDFTSLRLLKA
jgi:hypothetical protein